VVAPEQSNVDARYQELLRLLVDNKLISQAQANLVTTDHEATGMNVEDILLARRWVNEEKLDELAPWLKGAEPAGRETSSGQSYQNNLRKYRQMLAEILGESSE